MQAGFSLIPESLTLNHDSWIRLEGFVIRVSPNMIPLTRTLSRDSWCVARNQDAVRGLGYSLIPESRISIPDSLLGKRGSLRVCSALLTTDSPLPFPDSVMLLRGIGISP
jgi:hypothetical protein